MKEDLKSKLKRLWKGWGRQIVILVVIMVAFRSSIADWNDVPTGSMKPTILEGDRIFINKVAYDLRVPLTSWRIAQWSDPERGDIVVFSSPADGKRLVKRVIGLPGDVVELRENKLFINSEPAEYGLLNADIIDQISEEEQANHLFTEEHILNDDHPIMLTPYIPGRRTFRPVTVPEGHYFVMGDNRDNSADSRFFGSVKRNRIVGKAMAVALSFDRDRYFRPRVKRFFRSLP